MSKHNVSKICDLLTKIFPPVSIPTDMNNRQYNLLGNNDYENTTIEYKNYTITGLKCNNCHKLILGNVCLERNCNTSSDVDRPIS